MIKQEQNKNKKVYFFLTFHGKTDSIAVYYEKNKEINIRIIRFLANDNSCANNDYFNFNSELMELVEYDSR